MSKGRNQNRKRNRRSAAASPGNFTPLAAHQRQGGVLHTPWTSHLKTEPASWARERLPEMLWAVLAISGPSHRFALMLFRRTAQMSALVKNHVPKADITLTGLRDWPDAARAEFFRAISEWPDRVACLRPLLLFSDLPVRDEWEAAIGSAPEPEDWEYLKYAVAESFWHQSDKATDVRWLRYMFQLGCDRMKFVEGAIRPNTLTDNPMLPRGPPPLRTKSANGEGLLAREKDAECLQEQLDVCRHVLGASKIEVRLPRRDAKSAGSTDDALPRHEMWAVVFNRGRGSVALLVSANQLSDSPARKHKEAARVLPRCSTDPEPGPVVPVSLRRKRRSLPARISELFLQYVLRLSHRSIRTPIGDRERSRDARPRRLAQ